MKKCICIILILLLLYAGCSSIQHLKYPLECYSRTAGEKASVTLASGELINGTIQKIWLDSLEQTLPISSELLRIPASEIRKIKTKDSSKGAMDGLLYGSITGGIVSGIAAAVIVQKESRYAGMILLIPLVAIAGGIIGMPIGLIVGHSDTYVFTSSLPNEVMLIQIDSKTSFFEKEPALVYRPKSDLKKEINPLIGKYDRYITHIWEGDSIIVLASIAIKDAAWSAYIKGIAFGTNGRFHEAISQFKKAQEIGSHDLSADLYIDIANDVLERKIKALSAVLFFKGIECGHQWQFSEEIDRINRAIEKDMNYAPFYFYRGNAFSTVGMLDSAISDFTKAAELNPACAEAFNCRGVAYYNKGYFEEAISDFNRVIELNPDYFIAHFNKAHCYEKSGQIQEAISAFKMVIESTPPEYSKYIAYAEARIKEIEKK
jgi:tetratricopeptide (TPR) repeat protein